MGFFLAVWFGLLSGHAATVWNGALMTYTQPAPDPTKAANRDQLTPKVSFTRDIAAGLFNGVSETSYAHNVSPADTQWAEGNLSDYSTLSFKSWEAAGGGNPVLNLPGKQLVVHLVSEDIYLSLTFTELGGHSAGGFSYIRSTAPGGNVPPIVVITSPTNGASFTAPVTVPITANANDPDGTVTNVAFFDGGVFLGGTNRTPYTVLATLVTGSHALIAVGTDNLGLSITSAVVNVTAGLTNVSPSVTLTNPPDNAVFGNTDIVTLGASASDLDGSVASVQFFDGAVSLSIDATSPYSISTRLSLGSHTLTALATDNQGATTTSAPLHVTVARYLPAITNGVISLYLQPVATGMSAPDYAISPPGDSNRLFVVEQKGLLRIIQNGTLLAGSALDLQSRVQPPLVVTNRNDERGFLGLAFHPGFDNAASPGYRTLYTYNSEQIQEGTMPTYPVPTTATNNYKNVVNEWKMSAADANVVDPTSRREIISFGKNAANHNGGTIAFGPDGYLYLALGDGGNANDVGPSHIEPGGNAQNLSTPLGKMLRFDPVNPALTLTSLDAMSGNGQYRIPKSNPFQEVGQVPEIYAYGLRNPYRFSFDRANEQLIVADVGQNNIEEIDLIVRGGNYGWAIKEGDYLFNRTNGPAGNTGTIGAPPGNRSPGIPAGLIDPIVGTLATLEYDHNDGISITGGFVYRGNAFPALIGKYIFGDLALKAAPVRADGRLFYADLQTGEIHAFSLPQFGSSAILPNGLTVHGFGQDADGELYALVTNTSADGTGGIVYKLVAGFNNQPPTVAITSPQNGASFLIPGTVTLQATATDPDGGVASVEFFDGTNSLGHVAGTPYTLTVSLISGVHALTAVASDNQGVTATSTPVTVTVATINLTYFQRRMVSDIPGLAEQTDPNLLNPWGIAFSPTGPFWVTDTHSGVVTTYNTDGQILPVVVTIPAPAGATTPSSPIGIIYNETSDFLLAPGLPATFIFSTEDGTIAGWNSGTSAVTKVDNSAAVATYKGLASGSSGGRNYLYAPNFHSGQVDVFDANYQPVTLAGSFTDPTLPTGFAPYNIQNIDDQLYISYALQDAEGHDDVAGPGNGYVNVFDTSGHLIKRFASNGALNSPWGIVLAPSGFGGFSQALLIGNFGDGRINAFDPATGQFLGVVQHPSGAPMVIQGLWDLKFGNGGQAGDRHTLYFAAGIAGSGNIEDHGLFGSISPTANQPPRVTLTNPLDNAVFGNTDLITFGASTSDTDGNVASVQFFDGAVLLGNDTTSPFSVSTRLSLGSHTLTAVATDNQGATTTSAPLHVTVSRYLPPITNGEIPLYLQTVAAGMSAPDYAISPPGDSSRLFVVEQNGLLRIIRNGILLPGSALDLRSRVQPPLVVTNRNDERGFLGLAFHPGFNNSASLGYRTLYTYNSEQIPEGTMPTYPVPTTATNNYKNVVNEWKMSAADANVVDPASRREIISFGKNAANHNGGTITFGPDGYLYLGLGDGGNANDVGPSHIELGGNAQNLSTPLGKMLRFDPVNPALTSTSLDAMSGNGQYRIPKSNPFLAVGQVPEIYAYGLRNPYRFSFDRACSDLVLADVGQNNIEEINLIVRGGNYGWAIKEGDYLFNRTNGPAGNTGTIGAPPGNRSPGMPTGLIDPIVGTLSTLEYDHNDGISITGGFVYRGRAIPELFGKYVFGDLALKTAPVRADGRLFYADLLTGEIHAFSLQQFAGSAVLPNGLTVHGFGQDADGELYALVTNTSADGTGGIVYKLLPSIRLNLEVSGNLLEISWTVSGGHLESQTNDLSIGISTNWVIVPDSAGTNRVFVPMIPENGTVFYRLAIPGR